MNNPYDVMEKEEFNKMLDEALKQAVWVPGEELRASIIMLRQFADMHKEWPLAEAILRVLGAFLYQTLPPDAAVREAVEFWADAETCPPIRSRWAEFRHHALVLLRAVQAPRLTPEQGERLRGAADTLEAHGEVLEAQWLRAAFPEAFEGEVGCDSNN